VNPGKVASLCAPDVSVKVSSFGYSQTLSGRDDVRKAATLIRSSFTSLSIKFPDVLVRLAPDQQSANVEATLRGRGSDGRDLQFVELRFTFRKIEGQWLIASAETTSTLQ
jgi:hypothetical protein